MRIPFWRPRSPYGWGAGLLSFGLLVLPIALATRGQTIYNTTESLYQFMAVWVLASVVGASWIGTRLEARHYGAKRKADLQLLQAFGLRNPEPGAAVLQFLGSLAESSPQGLLDTHVRLGDNPRLSIAPVAAAAVRSGREAESEAAIRLAHVMTDGISSRLSRAAGDAAAALVVIDLLPQDQIKAFIRAFGEGD